MLDAAIVGIGWWGQVLVDAVQGKSDRIRFVAGATRTPDKVRDYAARQGFRLHESYEQVLADPTVQAVVLATPHRDHEAQMIAAARAGKHVFVEKPFTLDGASARRAVKAIKDAGVTLVLGHNRRFHPNMTELRARIRDGRLGIVEHIEATMTGPGGLFMSPEHWRADPSQSPVGGMAPLGIHMLDGMIDLNGPIADVICQTTHRAAVSGVPDTTGILLRFENGATGYLSALISTAASYRMCVYGSKGLAEIRTPGLDEFAFHPVPVAAGETPPEPERITCAGFDTPAAELVAFADAVDGRAPYPITPEEMIHGASVYEAIIASARDRSVVAVPK
ncbi:MAG: inositol 2-dehydrogenase IolG [Rhodobacteraceae bacterium HLUCCA12]|nr:MAG: inositol 2-dehydrogenase IolG [Rhodobacteraceae bacterium HLUCCA12]